LDAIMGVVPPQHVPAAVPSIRLFRLGKSQFAWLYLVLIAAAETLIVFGLPLPGLLLHAAVIILLTFHTALARGVAMSRLSLALTIVPLSRLLTLSLPLTALPRIAWYAAVSALLLIATFIVSRQLRLTRAELRLSLGNIPAQLLLLGLIPGLGASEYLILRPPPLVAFASWPDVWLPALVLIIFTGFCEEFIFRGLLQSLARPVLARWTLVYVALLFAAMHVGYRSAIDVVFVFGVGLLFGKLVEWGGSIFGVSLTHGLTNVLLLLVIPHLMSTSAQLASEIATGVVLLGALLAGIGMALLWKDRDKNRKPPLNTVVMDLRALRQAAQLTYIELAQRCGLPARVIAEIEHGWRRAESEDMRLILRALDNKA
jgi:uncharacterized protein